MNIEILFFDDLLSLTGLWLSLNSFVEKWTFLTIFVHIPFSDWMESPMMGGANPDGVDGEVGNYWRTLYKLEKNFDSIPTAKRIANKVQSFC